MAVGKVCSPWHFVVRTNVSPGAMLNADQLRPGLIHSQYLNQVAGVQVPDAISVNVVQL